VYTLPPRWLLDLAAVYGLRVMVGLWWEQFVTFLDDRRLQRSIVRRVRESVRALSGHPAVLCYSIANEIPSSVVRWHGARRVERFLHRLYKAIKHEDPTALVTYVNFPTTEYLRLPFLDLVCFNVYLESRERLDPYLARLQNLCDDRPLLMAEIGMDSRSHGEETQAATLRWQIRSAFDAGCCGTFVFSWTDEWYCGGLDIDSWDFGLTRRDRKPKPALEAVCHAYAATPFAPGAHWPRISVVVCSYNGEPTIRDTMDGLQRLDYPDYEVIVINDGSTDRTPDIVSEYGVKLVSTENRGLSNARNTGFQEAGGEIVAYIDDDAYPDPHWLTYLALEFERTDWVGVGGPNLPPPGDGRIADCVANAPGGPVQVLTSDRVAEHVPGCNMAFRKAALEQIHGFDPIYRAAGDDVDLCWRIQERGGVIGFAHSAVVWHHRRNSVRTYWKQQKGYGKAEALLERVWPDKYNASGHVAWQGRLYGRGFTRSLASLGGRVYRGMWGSAPFQSLYERNASSWWELPLMPEWSLLVALLGVATILGFLWAPLTWFAPLLAAAALLPPAQAIVSARKARFISSPLRPHHRAGLFLLTACMHLMQPAARLVGRIQHGLTPWRRRGVGRARWRPWLTRTAWRAQWKAPQDRLTAVQEALRSAGAVGWCGEDYDDWDLSVRGGLWGTARLRFAVEEHGAGKQMLRFRMWPRVSMRVLGLTGFVAALATAAFVDGAWLAGGLLAPLALGMAWMAARDAARALEALDVAAAAAEQDADRDAAGTQRLSEALDGGEAEAA
jgi:glycosyltransferase involved in cell wall biosynthesis